MSRKIVAFFPHNPYPPRTGAHKRALEVLGGLRVLGHHVVLASSELSSETPWTAASSAALRRDWVDDVRLYTPSPDDRRLLQWVSRLYRYSHVTPPIDSLLNSPPRMRRWFTDIVETTRADTIFMAYAFWNGLINHRRFASLLRIIDIFDPVSLSSALQRDVRQHLTSPLPSLEMIDDKVLREDFYSQTNRRVRRSEYTIFDRYDYTIALSQREIELIREHTNHTTAVYLPVTHAPCYVTNTYDGGAIFPAGPNVFNMQGYVYFVKRVLPRVLDKAPSFKLDVTGSLQLPSIPGGHVVLRGFLPDLALAFTAARFLVCPVFGGTGQQIKVVEAMAHGLAAVVLQSTAQWSPVRHRENGLVAHDAEEFAACVAELWNDPDLCRRLGQAARQTIEAEFSTERLLKTLETMVGGSSAPPRGGDVR